MFSTLSASWTRDMRAPPVEGGPRRTAYLFDERHIGRPLRHTSRMWHTGPHAEDAAPADGLLPRLLPAPRLDVRPPERAGRRRAGGPAQGTGRPGAPAAGRPPAGPTRLRG